MKGIFSRAVLAGLFLGATLSLLRAEQVLIFGDSLSKEYEFQWAGTFHDGVRSWSEILDGDRNDFFDIGSQGVFLDQRSFPIPAGHEYNWSIPGADIDDFVRIVRGETEEFIPFFPRTEAEIIEEQLGDVERFVLFVGGNDAENWYNNFYAGERQDAEVAEFIADTAEVLDWVLAEGRVDLQTVLVGIPHVGATPRIKDDFPPGPGRALATALYAEVNEQMRALAASRGVAFLDLFTLNLELLDAATFCYQGKSFINDEDSGGSHDYVWLGGPAAQGFHPNTIAQAIIGNEMIRVFNAFYGLPQIRWLTTEEIIEDWVGREANIPFAEWATCFGYPGALATDDPDGDGASMWLEFGLGMDPRREDRWRLPVFTAGPDGMGGSEIRLTYRPRLADPDTFSEVVPQWAFDLAGWTDAVAGEVVQNPDGSLTARFPAVGARLFGRVIIR